MPRVDVMISVTTARGSRVTQRVPAKVERYESGNPATGSCRNACAGTS